MNSNDEFHEDMKRHDENVLKNTPTIKCSCGKEGDLIYTCQICYPKKTHNIDGWQKCPICDGTGLSTDPFVSAHSTKSCMLCNGKRIINTITGKPPIL